MKTKLKELLEWDVPNWSQALAFWQPHLDGAYKEGTPVLTIGERYGGLSLWLAKQGKANICTDYVIPSDKAMELHQSHGVSELVKYEMVNIFELPYPDNSFDVVVIKSVIGGLKLTYSDKKSRTLENQKKAIAEIIRVLKPGGVYLGAENMRGGLLHRFLRKKTGRDKHWRYLDKKELSYLLDGFAKVYTKFYGYLGSNFKNKIFNSLTSFADKLFSALLPGSRLYIGFFVGKK